MTSKSKEVADRLNAILTSYDERLASLEGATTPPLPPPTPAHPPSASDPIGLPERVPGLPVKNGNAANLRLTDPKRNDRDLDGDGKAGGPGDVEDTAGIWISKPGSYQFTNIEISHIGGTGGRWQHSLYGGDAKTGINIHLSYYWVHTLTRDERLSRDHLAVYLEASNLFANYVLVGKPGEAIPSDIPFKFARYRDHKAGVAELENVVVYGCQRVALEALKDSTPLRRLKIKNFIILDPEGTEAGGADFIELKNIEDVDIETVIVLDRNGNLTNPAIIKASGCHGTVKDIRVYLPRLNPAHPPLVQGFSSGAITQLDPPVTSPPPITLDTLPELVEWAVALT